MTEAMSSRIAWLTNEVSTAINELRGRSPQLAAQIEGLPWIADGIQSDTESYAANGLITLADAGHLATLIEKPWVVEGRNYPALFNLSNSNLSFDPPETYKWVIDHPALNDGMTYQESKIIASLGSPDDAGRLDPESPHTIEERTLTLPLAGEVDLTIIRTSPERGYAGMMDDLEYSVRSHEEFMGLPFPQRQIIYVIAPGSGGNHDDRFVWIGDDSADYHTVAHEAAHYYWTWIAASWAPSFNSAWVHEGAAELLAYGPDAHRDDWAANEWYASCVGLTIRELQASPLVLPGAGSPLCWYPVGEAFYRDLYRAMDPTNFRLAFRRWLLHGMFDLPDVCVPDEWGYSTTYCHVMEAFTTYASEDSRAVVEDLINRWYGGAPLPDAGILGAVTGPDGRPARDVALQVYGRWVDPEPDGTFDVVVPSRSYIIEVKVLVGSEWFFVGWHDGSGGITTDLGQAFEVVIEGADVGGIEIVVPADRAGLLCPAGEWRSSRDGQCY